MSQTFVLVEFFVNKFHTEEILTLSHEFPTTQHREAEKQYFSKYFFKFSRPFLHKDVDFWHISKNKHTNVIRFCLLGLILYSYSGLGLVLKTKHNTHNHFVAISQVNVA